MESIQQRRSILNIKIAPKTASMVLYIIFFVLIAFLFVPTLNRQEQKLEQNVACVKTICINDGLINSCDNVRSQVVHYKIVHDRTGDILTVNLTGKSCL